MGMCDMATKRKAKTKAPTLPWYHPDSPVRVKLMDRLKEGGTLEQVCRSSDDLPTPAAVLQMLQKDDDLAKEYVRAREIGYAHMADQIIEIADTPVEHKVTTIDGEGNVTTRIADDPAHRKLQIDTRKWVLSKVLPKIYGDRVEHKHQVERVERITVKFGGATPDMIDITPKDQDDE